VTQGLLGEKIQFEDFGNFALNYLDLIERVVKGSLKFFKNQI
jgi:hypothetical protein